MQPASRLGVQALKTARAFRRERQLFPFVRHQNVLAPSNTALWREHVTARVPADTDAAAPGAHARTLRSRNEWIARWSRRWNVRRGFFKAGERLPLETRRATAAFALPFGTPAEKRGSRKRTQQQACASPAHKGGDQKMASFFSRRSFRSFASGVCRIVHTFRRPQRGSGTILGQHAPQLVARWLPSSPTMTKPLKTHKRDEARG